MIHSKQNIIVAATNRKSSWNSNFAKHPTRSWALRAGVRNFRLILNATEYIRLMGQSEVFFEQRRNYSNCFVYLKLDKLK